VVWGLSAESNDLSALLSKLKSACGAGGTLQGEQIELQGDHLELVKKQLREIGYKVR
jgi:translation initiation factor 1